MSFSARLYGETGLSAAAMREHRTRTAMDATANAEFAHYVVVNDLSAGGMRIESNYPLALQSEVLFDIPDLGRIAARIAWQDGMTYGCAFLKPLDLKLVKAKLASATVVWGDFAGGGSRAEEALLGTPSDAVEIGFPANGLPEREQRWPVQARFAIILGGGVACWAMVGIPLYLILG